MTSGPRWPGHDTRDGHDAPHNPFHVPTSSDPLETAALEALEGLRQGGAAYALAAAQDAERRMRQVKAMVHLGAALRTERGIEAICEQVAEAVGVSTGFRSAAINLTRAGSPFVVVAATWGVSALNARELKAHPPRLDDLMAGMQPKFQRGRSYFIPHQESRILEAAGGVVEPPTEPVTGAPGEWDPEDVLLTPLISPRTGFLLGVLSLDQPEDRRIPSLETISIIELFADQAALAIETSRIFAEREQERRMLDEGLSLLRRSLELARDHDLSQPAPPLQTALAPLSLSLNDLLLTLNGVLAEARAASEMVNQHASEVRAAAAYLAEGSQDQAERILELSQVIEGMAENVRQIATTAGETSGLAQDASEVSREGGQAAEQAAAGMLRVRELTAQTTKKVKRLGETVQDISMIVRVVENFTSRTNLLALNTSIEAARAGDEGRDFAAIAQEVRSLANHSAEATRQIQARIQAVQSETGQVARQIEQSAEQVYTQSELVSRAGSALEAVDSYTRRMTAAVQQISDIAMEQARVASQVTAAIRELAAVSTQARDGMEQARASMDYLVDLAGALQDQIAQFRLRERVSAPFLPPLLAPTGAPTTKRLPEIAALTSLLRPTDHPAATMRGDPGDATEADAVVADRLALIPGLPLGPDAVPLTPAEPGELPSLDDSPLAPYDTRHAPTIHDERALLSETMPATPAITRRVSGPVPHPDNTLAAPELPPDA